MAMRILSVGDFEKMLTDLGCTKTDEFHYFGYYWKAPDGQFFSVPYPPPDQNGIPDSVIDRLIEKFRLDGSNVTPIAHRYKAIKK